METLHGFGKTPLRQGLEVMETENCVIYRPTRRWHTTLISRSGGLAPSSPKNVGILMGSVLWALKPLSAYPPPFLCHAYS